MGHTTDFSAYLAHSIHERGSSRAYWIFLLDGSHITQMTSKLPPVYVVCHAPQAVKAEALIQTPRLADNITVVSLVSSAWASVPSSMTGEEDVVYGHLVVDRNAAIPGI